MADTLSSNPHDGTVNMTDTLSSNPHDGTVNMADIYPPILTMGQ